MEKLLTVDEGSTDKTKLSTKDFASFQHAFLREYIAVADRKASFFFTVGSAILAFSISHNVMTVFSIATSNREFAQHAGVLGVFALLLSIVLALLTVMPRLMGSKSMAVVDGGVIFWEDIAKFKTAVEYIQRVQAIENNNVAPNVLANCYILSRVVVKKYRYLTASGVCLGIGLMCTVLYLTFP